MKNVFKILLVLLMVITLPVYAESSKFSPKASLQTEELDKSNYFYIILSYSGEYVSSIEQEITYNGRNLEFIDAKPLNSFSIDTGTLIKDGRYRKVKIESKLDQDYDGVEYAVLTFRALNSFKIGKDDFIDIKDIKAYSSDNISKYKYDGIEIVINRETLNRVSLSYTDINTNLRIKHTISEYLTKFLIVVAIICLILLLIVLLPTKNDIFRTNRDREMSKKVTSKRFNRDDYRYNIEDIKQIGEKPKEEPKNKLELGAFDPFKDNVAKREDVKFDSSRDFRAVDVSVFNSSKANVVETPKMEEKIEELVDETPKKKVTKKDMPKLTKAKKIDRKNVKEGKNGLMMISSKKLDDANKDDLD